jgi:hypothetical protein
MSTATAQVGRTVASRSLSDVTTWPASSIFLVALALQLFHQLEHVVQVAQAKVLGIKPAHGILGSLVDLEWVHFVYNSGLYILLLIAAAALLRDNRIRPPLGWLWLGGVLAVQTYHVLEHVVKIVQHVQTGADPAPGILGFTIDLVWLHFTINAIVTIAMIFAFYTLGLNRDAAPTGRAIARTLVRPQVIGVIALLGVALLAGVAIALLR